MLGPTAANARVAKPSPAMQRRNPMANKDTLEDEGGLALSVSNGPGVVYIAFPKPMLWLGLEARLRQAARRANSEERGRGSTLMNRGAMH